MIEITLQPKDSVFTYQGKTVQLKNFTRNHFTGVWTFDMYYLGNTLIGVPITSGTDVVKGNGTPFYKIIFLDSVSDTGDITFPVNVKMYILEE